MSGLRQPVRLHSSSRYALLDKRGLETIDDYFYHETIQACFIKMIEGAKEGIQDKLSFQEDLIVAAGEAFGTSNFWDWIMFQFTHGSITRLHSSFLIETLNFIAGQERQTNPESWIRLLTATVDDSHVVTTKSPEYKGFDELQKQKLVPAQLSKVIVQWLRRTNGLYDFMCSLEVIFGNRRILSRGS